MPVCVCLRVCACVCLSCTYSQDVSIYAWLSSALRIRHIAIQLGACLRLLCVKGGRVWGGKRGVCVCAHCWFWKFFLFCILFAFKLHFRLPVELALSFLLIPSPQQSKQMYAETCNYLYIVLASIIFCAMLLMKCRPNWETI